MRKDKKAFCLKCGEETGHYAMKDIECDWCSVYKKFNFWGVFSCCQCGNMSSLAIWPYELTEDEKLELIGDYNDAQKRLGRKVCGCIM